MQPSFYVQFMTFFMLVSFEIDIKGISLLQITCSCMALLNICSINEIHMYENIYLF